MADWSTRLFWFLELNANSNGRKVARPGRSSILTSKMGIRGTPWPGFDLFSEPNPGLGRRTPVLVHTQIYLNNSCLGGGSRHRSSLTNMERSFLAIQGTSKPLLPILYYVSFGLSKLLQDLIPTHPQKSASHLPNLLAPKVLAGVATSRAPRTALRWASSRCTETSSGSSLRRSSPTLRRSEAATEASASAGRQAGTAGTATSLSLSLPTEDTEVGEVT